LFFIRFFSKIIGTILKYNLSWLTTILPNENCLDEEIDYNLRKRKALWTQLLESNNPYNTQWAQLGDLHGAINGEPSILTRAVIIGNNKEIIIRLLFVLTYFIRCSASSFFDVNQEKFDFDTIKIADDSLNISNEFLNCINDDTQREINIFDLNSSPIHRHNQNGNESFKIKSDESLIKTSSRDNSYIRSNDSSNDSSGGGNVKNKQRHISSNSLGDNCSAQELPLIG
jgi:hypothetical protein